jgi:hypothetical protein
MQSIYLATAFFYRIYPVHKRYLCPRSIHNNQMSKGLTYTSSRYAPQSKTLKAQYIDCFGAKEVSSREISVYELFDVIGVKISIFY